MLASHDDPRVGGKLREAPALGRVRTLRSSSVGPKPAKIAQGHVGKKNRVHIFWQKRIRAGDTTTPWWFPSETSGGLTDAARIALPIPPRVRWRDELPRLLPSGPERESKDRQLPNEDEQPRRRTPDLQPRIANRQSKGEKWHNADHAEKHQILEIVRSNFALDGETLVPTTRKPFDVLVEGLRVPSSRGDKTPVELFLRFCSENAGIFETGLS